MAVYHAGSKRCTAPDRDSADRAAVLVIYAKKTPGNRRSGENGSGRFRSGTAGEKHLQRASADHFKVTEGQPETGNKRLGAQAKIAKQNCVYDFRRIVFRFGKSNAGISGAGICKMSGELLCRIGQCADRFLRGTDSRDLKGLSPDGSGA